MVYWLNLPADSLLADGLLTVNLPADGLLADGLLAKSPG
jgi:hypothetical protein